VIPDVQVIRLEDSEPRSSCFLALELNPHTYRLKSTVRRVPMCCDLTGGQQGAFDEVRRIYWVSFGSSVEYYNNHL
jgi:hypothetical protein